MRWCVSIGAVLVAGAIAGGDVASVAAPNPATRPTAAQMSDSKGTPATVDIELILIVVAIVASLLPAQRASAVHPMEALREE